MSITQAGMFSGRADHDLTAILRQKSLPERDQLLLELHAAEALCSDKAKFPLPLVSVITGLFPQTKLI